MIALLLCPLAVSAAGEQATLPAEPDVMAVAAVVVELPSGAVLWSRNPHAVRAPASVTKMMTALMTVELASLDTKVTVEQSDLVGESSMGLEPGETLTVEALLYGILLPSGNDAATALARALGKQPGDSDAKTSVQRFVDKMNAKAKAFGTKETHFANPHGLDEPNHVTSASDLAIIGAAFAQNPTLLRIAGTVTYDGFGHTVHTTNKLLYDGRFPAVIGGKTGQTDDAGYTLIEIASKNGRQMLSVELGTTAESFWTDAMHLLAYGYVMPLSGPQARPMAKRSARAALQPTALATIPVPPQQPATTQMARPIVETTTEPDKTALAGATPVTTLTLPVAHSNDGTELRAILLMLLTSLTCGIVFARRAAVRRTLAEMKQEWQKGLADPPHLVVTAPMPVIRADTEPVRPSVSSRWEEAGFHMPRRESEVARAYALQAIRQASSGSRMQAQQAFRQAVMLNPRLEWGAIPGFWEIPPVSYADLATVLIEAGHSAVARSMLTVAGLAYPRHPDLKAVEARLNRRMAPPRAPHDWSR